MASAQRSNAPGNRVIARATRFSGASVARAAALALALVWALPIGPAVAATAARNGAGALGRAVEIEPPLNSSSPPSTTLFGVSCASPGACTAGGLYFDRRGHQQAMVVAQSRGRWLRASELRLPADAAMTFAEVKGIACAVTGYCAAVGDYVSTSGQNEAFFAREVGGRWLRAQALALPVNAATPRFSQLWGVACTGGEACTAAGDFREGAGNDQAMVVTEANGHLGRAREIGAPPNASTPINVFVSSISCFRAGSCVAAGGYTDKSGAFAPMSFTQTGGRWRRATAISLPGNALTGFAQGAPLNSVSCAATGFCTAVGEYYAPSGIRWMAISGSQGLSGQTSEITAAPPAAHPFETDLNSVSCPSAQRCVAVGAIFEPSAAGHKNLSMSLIRADGHWGSAHIIQPPANALTGADMHSVSYGISCTRSGYCAAVGAYSPVTVNPRAMAAVMP